MITKFELFKIINYENLMDGKRYYPYTNNGKNKWFFKKNDHNSSKIISDAYLSEEEAFIEASIIECEFLIDKYKARKNRSSLLIDDMTSRVKNKTISRDTRTENYKINRFISLCACNINECDNEISKLLKMKNELDT